MTRWRYLVRTLTHHWRINGTVALSVAAATAVLVGALLVGDSVRASLRRLTLDRLGRIDEVLVTDHFFRAELVEELSSDTRFSEFYATAVPAILFPAATVEKRVGDLTARAAGVQVLGCGESFWSLGDTASRPDAAARRRGDRAQSGLGRSAWCSGRRRSRVAAPEVESGACGQSTRPQVRQDSQSGRSAGSQCYSCQKSRSVPVEAQPVTAAQRLCVAQHNPGGSRHGRSNQCDTRLRQAAGTRGRSSRSEQASRVLAQALRPSLGDYGLTLKHVRRTFPEQDSARDASDL